MNLMGRWRTRKMLENWKELLRKREKRLSILPGSQICNHYNTETHNKQYEHKPLPDVDNSQVTILWNFPIRTDRTIQANRPDIVIKHKKNKTCQLIVWVCHQIAIFLLMSLKNLVNIKIWKLKLLRCGKMKTKTIPVIAEALGMIKKGKGNTKKC